MLKYTLLGTKFRYKIKKTVLALKELRDLDKKQEGAIAIIKTKGEEGGEVGGEGGEEEEEEEEKKETLHDTEFKSITLGNQLVEAVVRLSHLEVGMSFTKVWKSKGRITLRKKKMDLILKMFN